MSINIYCCGDTGPSGFGVATRGVIRQLIKDNDINITVKTHFWGLNREGIHFTNRTFPDKRFQEWLLRKDYVNDDYLIDDPRDIANRDNVNLLQELGSNIESSSKECMIRQFEGEEDIWLTFGGPSFAEQAPDNDDIYKILSTDYNLDIVPRSWEYYLDLVDEIWVPSKWTKTSIINRCPELEDIIYVFPYGINMQYKPTEYDCEVCPHVTNPEQAGVQPNQCLRKDATTFIIVSRFYHIKGLYRTIKAYIEEFRGSDDVQLLIKTTSNNQFRFNPVASIQGIINELGYPDTPEIGPVLKTLETQYLYDLLGWGDVFLQCSRAECFGIAQLQAAYCGTPVIYTDWSAQTELLPSNHDGYFPVTEYNVEKTSQEYNGLAYEISGNYPPEGKWAVPDIKAIQKQMRKIHEMNEDTLQNHGNKAREYVKKNFSWNDKGQIRINRLKEITNNDK